MTIFSWLLVGLGGGAGAMARYAVYRSMSNRFASRFPYDTLTVNITGSFLLGLWIGYGSPQRWSGSHHVIGIGFLGAFTTFSTFASESLRMLQQRQTVRFFVYQSVSFLATIAAVAAGWYCGKLALSN